MAPIGSLDLSCLFVPFKEQIIVDSAVYAVVFWQMTFSQACRHYPMSNRLWIR